MLKNGTAKFSICFLALKYLHSSKKNNNILAVLAQYLNIYSDISRKYFLK